MTNSLSLPLSLFIDILLQYTMLDFANYIRDEIGSKAPIVHKPATQDDPQRRRPDITRAKALLGYDVDTSREYIYIYISYNTKLFPLIFHHVSRSLIIYIHVYIYIYIPFLSFSLPLFFQIQYFQL